MWCFEIKNYGAIVSNKDLVTKEYVDNGLNDKQDSLPEIINNRYLHTSVDGKLEWVQGSGSGTTIHNDLTGRDAANAHPMSAITGLAAALDNKTNTSVIPNDGGEVKTKYRISQKGYTNGATWYYPIAKLPADNSGDYASAIINGRIGGWGADKLVSVYSFIYNRDSTGISFIGLGATGTSMSGAYGRCDIVVYTNSDTTDTIYLKCNSYFTFDIDLELFQSTAEILYDGSYLTSTPSGTLSAQASTSTKRLELVNGQLLVAGSEIAKKSDIPTTYTGW